MISPASVAFGSQRVGSASAAQQVLISNAGTATMAVQGASLSGADAAAFVLSNSCPATLAANAECSLSIGFSPTATGAQSASLVIQTNAPATAPVALSGTGTAPSASVSSGNLVFSADAIGAASAPQTLSLLNSGTAPLDVLSVALDGPDAAMFTQSNTCTKPIAPTEACTVTLTFTATSAGEKTATLALSTDALVSPVVGLAGSTDLAGANVMALKAFFAKPVPITRYAAVTTALAADVTAGATSIAVARAAGFPPNETFIAALQDGANQESVLVTGGMGSTNWTVIRGYNGSTPQAFTAGQTSVTWIPLATQRGATINGAPIESFSVNFTSSIGGSTSGVLVSPVPNGIYTFAFANGETREVTVQGGTAVTWSGPLAAGSVMTASSAPAIAPAGAAAGDPVRLLTQRFDLAAPVYVSQESRLSHRGAVLTDDLPVAGAPTMAVDTTNGFPQTGNFMVSTGAEDILATVAGPASLAIVSRAQNGTTATALLGSSSTLYQISQVDFVGGAGTQAFLVAGGLNSGQYYLAAAPTVGALREYLPKQSLAMHFIFDGASFEILASGNISAFVIADGVVQNAANDFVEPSYGGRYWHRFDFGSKKSRKITVFASMYPMAIAYPVGATLQPWDRSKDLFISWDGDSFGQAEGYSWSSAPDTGGLGFYFEAMLDLGLSQFDYVGVVGGTGYSQEGPASPPAFPRPKYSGAQRVAAVAAGPAPSIFLCGLGHNDNAIDRVQFAADTRAYWATLRAAWPTSVLVAAQYYFPAAGPAAPQAFQPNPLSTPNDPAILAALRAAGGPWVFVNTNQGTWQNSSGATGSIGPVGQPLLTGTGYGGAPGYAGGHTTGVGNGDTMIRDDGIHPSNLGAQFLGSRTAAAIIAGVLAL